MDVSARIQAEAARIAALPQDQIASEVEAAIQAFAKEAITYTLRLLLGDGPNAATPEEAAAA